MNIIQTIADPAVLERIATLADSRGWTKETLITAARESGFPPVQVESDFPLGPVSAIVMWNVMITTEMRARLRLLDLKRLKIKDRVRTSIITRLEMLQEHREAAIGAWSVLSLARHPGLHARNLFAIADAIWRECGDTSAGFDFYSKRFMLGLVYRSTLKCWTKDQTPGYTSTASILDRNISRVMQIQTVKWKASQFLMRVSSSIFPKR